MPEPNILDSYTKLNLGSGQMLLEGFLNFDAVEVHRGGRKTDMLGRIEDIVRIFGENRFEQILCSHVIEHFDKDKAKQVIRDCLAILKPAGVLIMEGPDIEGLIQLYNEGHPWVTKNGGIKQLIMAFYGHTEHQWGELGRHLWGYTKDTMAEVMTACGFEITFKGPGRTHGMGKRDFRVEGKK
jgi:predicted SAM-dependent methyltransferase